jgi:hypothetical protein
VSFSGLGFKKELLRRNSMLLRERDITVWLPEKLYELLPFLYGVAGLVTFYSFDTAIGYGLGILLMLSAIFVWAMRINHQAEKVPKQRKLRG